MKDFAAIDFETANECRSSVCSVGVVIVREGLPLVAHNSQFDEGCLKEVFKVYQMDYPDYIFYDTLAASKKFQPELENHQLQTAAAACGYDLTNHHHALADAEACAYIAMKLL